MGWTYTDWSKLSGADFPVVMSEACEAIDERTVAAGLPANSWTINSGGTKTSPTASDFSGLPLHSDLFLTIRDEIQQKLRAIGSAYYYFVPGYELATSLSDAGWQWGNNWEIPAGDVFNSAYWTQLKARIEQARYLKEDITAQTPSTDRYYKYWAGFYPRFDFIWDSMVLDGSSTFKGYRTESIPTPGPYTDEYHAELVINDLILDASTMVGVKTVEVVAIFRRSYWYQGPDITLSGETLLVAGSHHIGADHLLVDKGFVDSVSSSTHSFAPNLYGGTYPFQEPIGTPVASLFTLYFSTGHILWDQNGFFTYPSL